jgi:hypothetical protein
MQKMMKNMSSGGMPSIPGLGGGIGGALRARKALAGAEGTDLASLQEMMGQKSLPTAAQPRKTQPGKKKKKGGRVTPPKQR